jgi:hypothetical protein
MKILPDGSIEGSTFSGEDYKGGYPSPKSGWETYREYNLRVKSLVKEGFHLGDLSWRDYGIYCRGSGHYDDFDSDKLIP